MNKITFDLPSSWSDITVKKYLELLQLNEAFKDDSIIFKTNLISILSEKDIDEVNQISIMDLNKLVNSVSFFSKPIPNTSIPTKIIINNQKYNIITDISLLSASQYIDLKMLLKRIHEEKENIIYSIDQILAIFFIPEKKKYGDIPNKDIADNIFNYLPIDIANSLLVFFYQNYTTLINYLQSYLVDKMIPLQLKKIIYQEE